MKTMNYFGYTVQEDGVIVGKRGTPLTPHDNGKGYLIVNLQVGKNRLCKAVHRLLAECFIPNPLCLSDVDHIDGNKRNDDSNNLQVLTRRDNILKAHNDGVYDNNKLLFLEYLHSKENSESVSGELNGMAKLTNEQVRNYRIKHRQCLITKSQIILETGMSRRSIENMLNNKTYVNV